MYPPTVGTEAPPTCFVTAPPGGSDTKWETVESVLQTNIQEWSHIYSSAVSGTGLV